MSSPAFARTAAATLGFAAVAVLLTFGWSSQADQKAEPAKRVPWTTSKVTGSPEPPPPYKAVRAFQDVKFHRPLLFVPMPGTDRLFVGEQDGSLYSFPNRPDAKKELAIDLRKELKTIAKLPGAKEVGELYGLAFHPEFAKNRKCFVCYTLRPEKPSRDGRFENGSRVSRFTVTETNPPRLDPASEEIILTFTGGGHNGGDLHFGPDGYLYISTGDAAGPNPPDPLNTGQDCSDLLASILRIDVNRNDDGKSYSIPKDNPFVGTKDVRPEIWAFGFRNPWRMSFDRQTGDLWVGDVGWELWEMVHRIEKGGNYGWSITEARQAVKPDQKIGPTPIRAPAIELPHTIAASVTGGYVYRGKRFPELVGAYIFGDWETRRLWAARFADGRLKEMPEVTKPTVRPSAFGLDHAGELYFCDYDNGFIFTLARNDVGAANAKFPTKLSETGLFADVKKNIPAPGVVPFDINARQWQDGAQAEYLLALPGDGSVSFFDKPRALPGQVFWHNFGQQFPAGTVLVKTLTLPVVVGAAGVTDRRIETQILHHDGEDWRGYTFAWRDDQSDADLVPADGAEKTLTVPTAVAGNRPGTGVMALGKREQVWTFHSRTQCLSCHNAWSEYALAFNLRQLNRDLPGANQLVRLAHSGHVRRVAEGDKPLPPFDAAQVKKLPKLAGYDSPAPLDVRARSYLHANCAHCHRFGGGGGQVVLELDFDKPLKETNVLDARPRQGDFGLPDARLVAPGDPFRSVVLYRMAKFGRGRMPHLGSEHPDFAGLDLTAAWIASLRSPPKDWQPAPPNRNDIPKALSSFEAAYPFARALNGHVWTFGGEDGGALLVQVQKSDPGPVRDLFEGHLPVPPGGRKLGSNPRPGSILALAGDPVRGETLFFDKEMKCANCHKVGDRGVALGPDLTAIGKTRTRAELLDSLLNPSAKVEPQYAAYNVRTKDDKSYTGIIVSRSEKELRLRDAEAKEVVIAGDNVEGVRPSRVSLMPDGQMSSLTPQQAADLLEYLVRRK